ncbi:hypothetical protein KAFR_0G01600 [Kazachstania africana CBS 2517]|uniref:NADPH-dependent diflavin oxidoreductase 1 n=1 Tax=Kazachstania africana (strain ATCC 22294 / BCRC 22015 / CBS 2517 / CECT 1963 / NBRC 1671 / NRRL Y-8276) TaxID=1071382 RepID=H2AXU4_KAZAF|nr:hypothetical protein KAFR_0G01600 [Kazachstania africana CBS 2517]CCF59194.1 hypothetical protein KAFR_0G01600 [Kazachstania africana CBS 2517]
MSSHKIVILYGSETGNSEDFATILSHKLRRLQFPHTLSAFGDFDPSKILETRYLFIIAATTGQGELPRNVHESSVGNAKSKTLWSILKRKKLPANFLSHVQVSFLGLGDSSYPKFNFGIRKLHQRMVGQLGAKELFDRLEADERGMAGSNKGTGSGIETVYFEYEKRVTELLMKKFPRRCNDEGLLVDRVEIDSSVYIEPKTYLEVAKNELSTNTVVFKGDASIKYGIVTDNKRITKEDHFQDVRQFIFNNEKQDERPEYYPGDTVSIYPCNTDINVQRFLDNQSQWLEFADEPLEFTNGVPEGLSEGGLVEPLTLRNILKYHCDLMAIPRTSFFMKIWMFATDVSRMERGQEQLDQQRDKLYEFATDQDMQELYDYCNRPRRSILELVEDFLSLRLPWQFCLDFLPKIKPRYYSISSGACDENIETTVAIVKYKTILKKIRKGICTNYIASLKEGDRIRYKIQNNHLIKDEYKDKPMILMGPGVGLAPLLSVIKSQPAGRPDINLFFGCRFKDKDYFYEELLESWNKNGDITLYPVFSRDRENSPDCKYIQDAVWKFGPAMTNLMVKEKALLFLCGASGKMPIQIRLTLIEMLKKWGGFKDEAEAKNYLKEMEREDRYLQETW